MKSSSIASETKAGHKLYVCYDCNYVTKEKYGKEKHQNTNIYYLERMGNTGGFFLSFLYFLIFYSEHVFF